MEDKGVGNVVTALSQSAFPQVARSPKPVVAVEGVFVGDLVYSWDSVYKLSAGEDFKAAVDKVNSDSNLRMLLVLPGIYHFTEAVDVSGFYLVGVGWPSIYFDSDLGDGAAVKCGHLS